MLKRFLARAWRGMSGSVQWRVLWLRHAKFMVGVTGVVRDGDGRVLLLKHRFWPEGRQWGLPSGYANKGETFEDTFAREVREETGLEVRVHGLRHLKSGFQLRMEVAFEAEPIGGTLRLNALEILDGGWFHPGDLPGELQPEHRALIHTGRVVAE
ncbi:NUDIX hydrolase [Sphaerisporangium siamense]|uniref:8-oxo-dGTP pyrophosphatase MutT (NUDIX family) n=1 Tax=Sphaerisporangium siamense TaxID=795645 RepID=A0A7W7DFH6_9ACTN|nr:NUDIX domain-containing protein [Sphaerisporangium siamense]MBB4705853.1 8-oxo-dGTP pyrophosphatase MutT (NUDIX family) [Sphaerisporangium siamense]GII82754.1 NUDIX hydrolase [Sphaerisporangium siamense]